MPSEPEARSKDGEAVPELSRDVARSATPGHDRRESGLHPEGVPDQQFSDAVFACKFVVDWRSRLHASIGGCRRLSPAPFQGAVDFSSRASFRGSGTAPPSYAVGAFFAFRGSGTASPS